jgi:formylglycine-generating enzyme required for sulfatase activity
VSRRAPAVWSAPAPVALGGFDVRFVKVRPEPDAARASPQEVIGHGIATPEDKEWESTLIANRLDHYLDFLKRYPQSLRRTEALKRLLSLRPSLSAEEQDWIDALSADTPEAYMYYLRKHPKGKYGAEARQRIIQFNLTPAEMKRLEAAAAERLRLQQNASSTADSDGDGTTDQKDGCPQDKNKIAPGICGCGTPDADTDGDGIPDCKDDCPKDRGSMAQKGCPGKPADAVTNAPATTNAPANTAPPGDVPAPSSGASSSETTQAVDVPPTPAAPASTGAGRSGMQMVPVTGGSYEMGNDDDDDPGNFAHKVRLGNFQIGRYEVTQADWRNIMGKVPAKAIPRSCDQCPVTGVSWDEVQQFLIQLNEQQPGKNYRLPTEAEWEYAARGGKGAKKTQYPGATELPQVAWYSKNASGRPRVVGEKSPNALGLYDMIGNVSEWCRDLMGYYPTSGVKENPTGPSSGTDRICRGGGWDSDETTCRATERMSYSPATRNAGIGFRLVCDQ